MAMTTAREIGGTDDRYEPLDQAGELGASHDHGVFGRRFGELERERRAKHIRQVALHCGLIFALYLVAGAVFSSVGWNAWLLLGGAWAAVVAFAIMSDRP